ncbi:MAG TPA: GNAT family N-acetyltransferase [Bacteroidales bacterium]|nr:GNAT family N-acetyltransferase [Bacteroidales bacterium]
MEIIKNPFTSYLFTSKWLKHFCQNLPAYNFNFIGGLNFFKPGILPVFINTGRNLTKGVSYTLSKQKNKEFKNSVLLIYDVPAYVNVDISNTPENVILHKIKQYPGYLIELHKYKDHNDYLESNFSKNTNRKLKKYQKRLELCFNITYKMYFGNISKKEYDFIFVCFKILLEKRFACKKTTNNNINPEEWAFYYEVAFPMILEKSASLFVVYEGSNPIAVTLNYLSENILFDAITVFDNDYSKFNPGKIALANLTSWCFENRIQYFDFSKGYFDYKTHWMSKKYDFEYHLYFDKTSFRSTFIGIAIKKYFELKQFLRKTGLNNKLHELTFRFKKNDISNVTPSTYNFSEVTKEQQNMELQEIKPLSTEYKDLKSTINEFLFLNCESIYNLKVMKTLNNQSTYLFIGKKVSRSITINCN